jgi:hypothetical protein
MALQDRRHGRQPHGPSPVPERDQDLLTTGGLIHGPHKGVLHEEAPFSPD